MPRPSRTLPTVLISLFAALAGTWLFAQQQPEGGTFRVQANTVVVDLIVTDKHGKYAPGLTSQDFVVYEDGVPQKLVQFSPPESDTTSPAPSPGAAPPEPRLSTGSSPVPEPRKPHFLTVVLDLADNRPENIRRSGEAIQKYLDNTVSQNDYVALYYIDRSLHLALPFTNDVAKAKDAVKALQERLATGNLTTLDRRSVQEQINDMYASTRPAATLGVVTDAPGQDTGARSGPTNSMDVVVNREINTLRNYLSMQNTFQARSLFMALRAICLAYRDFPGRKNVVLFSEGFMYSEESRPEMEAVIDAANRANVAFYVIDPEGLEITGGGVLGRGANSQISQMVEIANSRPGGPGSNPGGQTKFDQMRNLGETGRGEQLESLADTTGGLMVKNTNDLLPAFARVVNDARDVYTLVYQPTNKEFDGKFRRIKVELTKPGLQLRYRQGYWAIPHGQAVAMTPAAAQMLATVQGAGFHAAVVPDLYATALLAPDGKYTIPYSVSLPGSKVPLEKSGDEYKGSLSMAIVVRDMQGQIIAVGQHDIPLKLTKDKKAELERSNVVRQGQISVPTLQPYDIQALVQLGPGSIGAGRTSVPVPASPASGMKVTGILLSDRAEQATCSDSADALCFQNVRLFQPAKPQFVSTARVIVYYAASDLSLDPQTQKPRVGVTFTVKSGKDVVKSAVAENVQAVPGPTPNSVLLLAELPLKTLHPGTYTLQAVTQNLVKQEAVTQEAQFTVQ